MTNLDQRNDEPDGGGSSAPEMTSREAVDTLIGAVQRAGAPWAFVPSGSLAGRDLTADGARVWPVCHADGEMLGMVVRDDGASEHDELIFVLLRMVSALVVAEQSAAEALARAQAAEREARVDPLTGVLTRRAWSDALAAEEARMRRNGKAAVVVVIDIDRLKEANDTDGHLAGDLLIRRTAEALRQAVRDSDRVARLGGDEFGVLAVESEEVVPASLVKRIEQSLCNLHVEASVGAAVAPPGTPLQDAVERADRAMYAEKRRRQRARHAERFLDADPTDALG